jgi:hypothetical protein
MKEFLFFSKNYEQILIIFIFYWIHIYKIGSGELMDKVTESTSENEKGRGAEEWITIDVGQTSSQHLQKRTLGAKAGE